MHLKKIKRDSLSLLPISKDTLFLKKVKIEYLEIGNQRLTAWVLIIRTISELQNFFDYTDLF